MKRYDEYKDSGVEWIGEVPRHWKSCRFKDFMKLSTTASDSIHKIGLENIESATGRFIETNTEFEGNGVEFKKDSIVYGKLRPYLQKVWLAEFEGNAVGDFFVFNAKSNSCPLYIKYLMLSDGFTKEADGSTFGAKMPRVSSDFILTLHFCLPPIMEQMCIASYLDKKCSEIDNVISAQQKRIALLQELKQSVITHAVTKGLNPNVEMKDSGVEWIGKVPKHWEVMKTSLAFNGIGSGTTPSTSKKEFYDDEGKYWLQTGDLNDGMIFDTSKKVSDVAIKACNLKFYPKDSVVIAMYGATIGKVGILGIKTATNQACCVLPANKYMVAKYSFYEFLACKPALLVSAIGGGQPNISQDTIRKQKIAVPPYIEQQEIAGYLDKKCASIDSAISKAQHQVELLQEYKQSLITEVVTGKRKVS